MPYPKTISLARILQSLSRALDLTTTGIDTHHQVVALVSMELARELALGEQEREDLYFSALIHDVGISTSAERLRVSQFDRADPSHAQVGHDRLAKSAILSRYAKTVRHHHDRWDGSTPGGAREESIPMQSRIIHVADRFATLVFRSDSPEFRRADTILARMQEHNGTHFDPTVLDCLECVSTKERFLLDVTTRFMSEIVDELAPARNVDIDLGGLLDLARIFADVIDKKSPFTSRHSQNVALVASNLARAMGFSSTEVTMMAIAGLLHDLGKLAIDDSILDKQGSLGGDEQMLMRQHPYFTFHILRIVRGLETISEWAAFHHERLNGEGYPFHLRGDEIPLGARIMAVADIFSALSEDRPYRPALAWPEIVVELRRLVRAGHLDANVVSVLEIQRDEVSACTERHVATHPTLM